MSEQEQIEKVKRVALNTVNPDTKIKTIDTLAAFGVNGIPAIADIANNTFSPTVKRHALDTIKRVKTG